MVRLSLVVLAIALPACSSLSVDRVEPWHQTDLSGAWNDTDARIVADGITERLNTEISGVYLGTEPSVIVGALRNRGTESVDLRAIERWIETKLIRGGALQVVAGADMRPELRSERQSQSEWAREETQAAMRAETGAGYLLQGTLHTWEDRQGRQTVRTYRVDVNLVDLETTEQVWAGSEEIKKVIRTRVLGM